MAVGHREGRSRWGHPSLGLPHGLLRAADRFEFIYVPGVESPCFAYSTSFPRCQEGAKQQKFMFTLSPLPLSHTFSGILQLQRELIFTCSISCGAVGCDSWRWRLFSPFLLHLSFPRGLKRRKIVIVICKIAWLRIQRWWGRAGEGGA